MFTEIKEHYRTIIAFVGGGFIVSIVRYVFIKFFKDVAFNQRELFDSRNKHAIDLENHEMRIRIMEKQIDDLKIECKENHRGKRK